ncbi:hypothetical protein WDU94_007899 [Cyamophila willieti]
MEQTNLAVEWVEEVSLRIFNLGANLMATMRCIFSFIKYGFYAIRYYAIRSYAIRSYAIRSHAIRSHAIRSMLSGPMLSGPMLSAFVTMTTTPTLNAVIVSLIGISVIQILLGQPLLSDRESYEKFEQYRPEKFRKIDVDDSRGEGVRLETNDNFRNLEIKKYRSFREVNGKNSTIKETAIGNIPDGNRIIRDSTGIDRIIDQTQNIVADNIPLETEREIPNATDDKDTLIPESLPEKQNENDFYDSNFHEHKPTSLYSKHANETNQTVDLTYTNKSNVEAADRTYIYKNIFLRADTENQNKTQMLCEVKKLNTFLSIVLSGCLICFLINMLLCIIQLFMDDS